MSKKITAIALSATTVVWLSGASMLVPVAFAQSTTDEIASLQALITQLTSQLSALQGTSGTAVTVTAPASSVACSFTRNLTVGSQGADVKCLQQYLNGAGFSLASSGAGSPGNETMYFGPITRAAVVKWQDANAAGVLAPVGLAKGTGFFGPSSRSYFSSMAVAPVVTPPVVTPPVVTPTTPTVGTGQAAGSLIISLAGNSPASANVPKGASSVPYMKFVVSGSGTLDSLTFVRTGLGATADFGSGGIYLYDGGTRLTTGKSVNGTTHEVLFVALNQAISGSKTYTLVADMATGATAGDISAFKLTHVNGVKLASAVQGNEMAVSSVSSGGITIAENGSVAAPNVGSQDVKIGEFKLTANSVEDLNVRRIVLTQGGSTNAGNLTNLELFQSGTKLASVAGFSGRDLFVFELAEPFKLLKGQNRVFELYADVSPLAKTSETINLYVDNTADVLATGDTYGYGVAVTNSWASADQTLTLLGAEMTLTWHGPKARNIEANGQDVVLFDFSVSAKNNIEIRNLRTDVTVTNITASTEGFNDFKVIDADTGAAVTTSYTVDENSDDPVFSDVINVAAGTVRHFQITADIDSDNDSDDTITVNLAAFGASDVKNLDNNTFLVVATDIVPSGVISGTLQTVKTTSVEVLANGSPAAHTAVAGASDEGLLGVNLTARNGDVKVTSIKVSASSTNGSAANVRNALRTLGLYIDGTLVSSKKSLVADSTVSSATFSNLSITIPEGQTKTVIVKAEAIATDAAAKVYFVYADKANFTTVDMEGNDITPSTAAVNGSATSAGSITVTVGTPTMSVIRISDQDSAASNIVAGREQLLAKYDFFSKFADQTISKLRVGLNIDGSSTSTSALAQEVSEIRLYDGDGTLLASGSPESSGTYAGSVRFEDNGGLFSVAANETKRIEVRALLNSIDQLGVGAIVSTMGAYVSGDQFESVSGATTNTTLYDSDGSTDLADSGSFGLLKRMYRSVPTVTVSSPSSSTLTTGQVELLKFTVAADSAGDIEWGKLEFTTSLSNATFTVSTNASQTIDIRYAGEDLTLTTATLATTGGEGIITLTTPERIAAGTSKTYELLATIGSMAGSTTAASVSTVLDRDSSDYVAAGTFTAGEDVATNSFVWSDLSRSPHSTASADWHNAWKVKTLPSGAKALVK